MGGASWYCVSVNSLLINASVGGGDSGRVCVEGGGVGGGEGTAAT